MKEITFITNIPFCPLYITNESITKKYNCNETGKLTLLLKYSCVYKISSPQNCTTIYINNYTPSKINMQPNCNELKKQVIKIHLTDQHYYALPIKKGMIIFEN